MRIIILETCTYTQRVCSYKSGALIDTAAYFGDEQLRKTSLLLILEIANTNFMKNIGNSFFLLKQYNITPVYMKFI